jgi:hypothetical protein
VNSWDLAEEDAGTAAGASVKSSVGLTAAAASEEDTSAAASSRLPLNLLNIAARRGEAGMGVVKGCCRRCGRRPEAAEGCPGSRSSSGFGLQWRRGGTGALWEPARRSALSSQPPFPPARCRHTHCVRPHGQRHLTGLQIAQRSASLGLRPYSSSAANPAHTAPDCRPPLPPHPPPSCCFILQGKN